MTKFLTFKAETFTIVVDPKTGNSALVLNEDIAKTITEQTNKDTTALELLEITLDAMGKEAELLLDLMGQMNGAGGELAAAYGQGGIGALGEAISGLAESKNSAWTEGFGDGVNASFLPEGFEEAAGSDLADYLGLGPSSQGGKSEESGEEDGSAAIAQLIASQSHLMEDDGTTVGDVVMGAGIGLGAIVGGALAAPGVAAIAAGAAVGAAVGGVIGYVVGEEVDEELEKIENMDSTIPRESENGSLSKAQIDAILASWEEDELGQLTMPSDPDAGYVPGIVLDEDPSDLDETTQPGADVDEKPVVDLEDKPDLDPLINPGNEPVDEFDFGSSGPVAPTQGHDYVAAEMQQGRLITDADLAEAELDLATESPDFSTQDDFIF